MGIRHNRWVQGAALAALVTAMSTAGPVAAAPPRIGAPAPDFHLTLVDGTKVSLADLRGEVVVLNFWATWCAPCKKELPLLDAYYRTQAAAGLKVFAVTTEDSLPLAQLGPLAAALTIPMVRRISGGDYATVKAVPTNYIIDRAGILRYAKAASLELDDLNEQLVPLLRQAAPAATGATTPAAIGR